MASGWNKDSNGYNGVYTSLDTKFDNFNNEPSVLEEEDRFEHISYEVALKFFLFVLVGGLLVAIVLIIIYRCCIRDGQGPSTTPANMHNDDQDERMQFTSIDCGPTSAVGDLDVLAHNVLLTQLDLPPSYDVSTENSRYNSTHDVSDLGARCEAAPESVQDETAPPSYSEVCQANVDNVE